MDSSLTEGPILGEGSITLIVGHANPTVNLTLLLPLQTDREGYTDCMAKPFALVIVQL